MPDAPLFTVEGLVSGYGGGRVLHGVDLALAPGEILGLLGRNGAGKTTLLKTVMGLLTPREGRVTFDGADITGQAPFMVARRGIAYVPQGREIFADFTVEQNLRLGNLAAADCEVAYATFPFLRERAGAKGGSLSGGEQQQLAIGRALMGAPRLLLLDEPSEGIQPSIVMEIADILRRVARDRGLGVVLVEQNVDMVTAICGRCAFIENGAIAEDHPMETVVADPAILDRYLAF